MYQRVLPILLFYLMSCSGQAQIHKIAGRVIDSDTRKPVEYVTVYVNGTTKGTTTDSEGTFDLKGIVVPCELILSHVSYDLQRVYFTDTIGLSNLRFELSLKIVPIQEVTVIGDSARLDYLARFKVWFLGANYEETGARILNDSVLYYIPIERDLFEAYANEPLVIDLPQTGYRIMLDLAHFRLTRSEELGKYHCSILGSFYFQEIPAGSRWKQRAHARNRVENYYNSRLHFCRSLYENRLKENGYELVRACLFEEKPDRETSNQNDFKHWYSDAGHGNSVLNLTDFPCRFFNINYYHERGNRPADLTYPDAHPSNLTKSGLYFANDTIHIYSTGRVAENSILFYGSIGDKGVAWMLPEDYIPSMQ